MQLAITKCFYLGAGRLNLICRKTFQKPEHDTCARIKMTFRDSAERLYDFGRIIFQREISMCPGAKRALDGQWIFIALRLPEAELRIDPPEILDQVDAVAATKCQSKGDDPRLMFKKHFAACWHVICFAADSKTASCFY